MMGVSNLPAPRTQSESPIAHLATKLVLPCPAKLNLALAVGSPDDTGMHPICSWMVTLDFCDELTITRLPDDRFSRYAIVAHKEAPQTIEVDWPIQGDLAVRAHLALENHVDRRLPIQMKLEKRIPVGGGLGGGSSNAAAMLRGLNEVFALDMPDEELIAIAATLGSDVPFFIAGGSAIVEGLGDSIEQLAPQREPIHVALIFPEARCPTGPVYGEFDAVTSVSSPHEAVRALAAQPGAVSPGGPFNDLAPAAMRIAPELVELSGRITSIAERPAHVSGSGSTLFVICDDAIHAEFLAKAIAEQLNVPACAASTLG